MLVGLLAQFLVNDIEHILGGIPVGHPVAGWLGVRFECASVADLGDDKFHETAAAGDVSQCIECMECIECIVSRKGLLMWRQGFSNPEPTPKTQMHLKQSVS